MLKRVRQWFWDWRGVVIVAPAVTGMVLALRFTGLLQAWEWSAYDQYMLHRPAEPPDDRIVIVGISDNDLKAVGQTIISDGVYARLLEKLKARKPRAIGLDVYRDLPVEPGHAALVKVFKSTPNLVGIQKVVGTEGHNFIPPDLKEVGANDLIADGDNRVRRSFIYVNNAQGDRVFSFGFILAMLYLQGQGVQPEVLPNTDTIKLAQATLVPFSANDGGYVRAEDGGYQMLLNYRGGSRKFQTVSMSDVLNDKLPPDWGRDRVILIGAISDSFQDLKYTPYSSTLLSLPELMAGVEVHANLTSQVISAALNGRNVLQTWSESVEWLWIGGWALVGATLSWQTRQTARSTRQRMIGTAIAGSLLWITTYGLFVAGWWVPIIPPFLAMLGSTLTITAYIASSAGRIRKTFGRYLSDEIVANLLESPKGLSMGGERREITILTSDLRGFTATAERLPPEEVIRIINFYLSHMADIITQHQGTIDEFMGDGILVLFGAPTQRPDDARRAIACAVAMQLEMETVNQTIQEWGYSALEMGIGINTGEVVVGNIGSEKRTKYGVMGSQVNLTYRIESYTTAGQILLTETTLQQAGPDIRINGRKEVQPKGVQGTIAIFDIGGIGGEYNLFLTREDDVLLPLPAAISAHYTELSGKHLEDETLAGWLTHLSAKGALLKPDVSKSARLSPLTNLKLNFVAPADQPALGEDVYAKVMENDVEEEGAYIQFTSKPPAIAAYLKTLYTTLPP